MRGASSSSGSSRRGYHNKRGVHDLARRLLTSSCASTEQHFPGHTATAARSTCWLSECLHWQLQGYPPKGGTVPGTNPLLAKHSASVASRTLRRATPRCLATRFSHTCWCPSTTSSRGVLRTMNTSDLTTSGLLEGLLSSWTNVAWQHGQHRVGVSSTLVACCAATKKQASTRCQMMVNHACLLPYLSVVNSSVWHTDACLCVYPPCRLHPSPQHVAQTVCQVQRGAMPNTCLTRSAGIASSKSAIPVRHGPQQSAAGQPGSTGLQPVLLLLLLLPSVAACSQPVPGCCYLPTGELSVRSSWPAVVHNAEEHAYVPVSHRSAGCTYRAQLAAIHKFVQE